MQEYIAAAKTLCEELEQLHTEEPNITNRANKAAKLIRKTLTAFRRKIRGEDFPNREDEIHFFKYIKPRVSSYLIFYSVIAEIESERDLMNESEFTELVDKKRRMFRYIMRENRDFVNYYRAGLTHLDRVYFVRGKNMSILSKHSTRQQDDPEFNTSQCSSKHYGL